MANRHTTTIDPGRARRAVGTRPSLRTQALPLAVLLALGAAVATAQEPQHLWTPATNSPTAVSPPARGAGVLQVFATRAELLAAADGTALRHEDFSAGFTDAGMVSVCIQAVGHRSDDPCFAPGDLQPGFGIRPSRGSIFFANAVALGEAILNTPTKVVGANTPDSPWNPTRIDFDPHATVIGMDVFDGMQGGTVQLWAYGPDDALLGSFTVETGAINTPAFAGFISPMPVERVEINALADGGAELLAGLVYGGGAGRLAALDADLEFGAVAVGASAVADLNLINIGHLELSIDSLPIASAPFQVLADSCTGSVLAMDQTCTVQLEFAPEHEGSFVRTLSLADGEQGTVHLRGQARVPRLATQPGHLDFGSVVVGATSSVQTLTLSNLTGAVVGTSEAALVSAPFQRVGGDCDSGSIELQPGAACTLELVFAPGSEGEFDADLHIHAGAITVARASLYGHSTLARGGAL